MSTPLPTSIITLPIDPPPDPVVPTPIFLTSPSPLVEHSIRPIIKTTGLLQSQQVVPGAVKVVRFRQTELIWEFPETGFWSAIEAAPEKNQGLGVTVEIAWVITIVAALIIVMLLFWFLLRGSDRVVTLITEGEEVPLGIIIPKWATRPARSRPTSTRLAPTTPIDVNRQKSSSRRAVDVPQADGAEQVDDFGLAVLVGDPGDIVNNASNHGSLPEPMLRSSTTRIALILPNLSGAEVNEG